MELHGRESCLINGIRDLLARFINKNPYLLNILRQTGNDLRGFINLNLAWTSGKNKAQSVGSGLCAGHSIVQVGCAAEFDPGHELVTIHRPASERQPRNPLIEPLPTRKIGALGPFSRSRERGHARL